MPLTDARLAEIAARHRRGRNVLNNRQCGTCEGLWPCDAALVAEDNQRLREGLAALLAGGG